MREPLVSVIMSVFNTKREWLDLSIKSILRQTLKDFEFIIVLDCPTDGCDEIVRETALVDSRIRIIENECNLGLTRSLNKALAAAEGKYIARMDADDVAFFSRLEKQYKYMEEHPNVAALGTQVCTSLDADKARKVFPLCDWDPDRDILDIRMLFHNVGISHSTAMIRHDLLKEHAITYDERILKSQDYKLWVDLLPYGEISMIDEVLLMYRVHSGQISSNRNTQLSYAHVVSKELAEQLSGELTDEELEIHYSLLSSEVYNNDIQALRQYMGKMLRANNRNGRYNRRKFKRELAYIWCQKAFRRSIVKKQTDMLFQPETLNILRPSLIVYGLRNKRIKGRRNHAINRMDINDCLPDCEMIE